MKKIATRMLAVAIAFTTLVSASGVMTVNAEAATKKNNVSVEYNKKKVKKVTVKKVSATVDGAEKEKNKVTVYLTGKNKVKVDTAVKVVVNGKKAKATKSFKKNVQKVTYSSSNKNVATVSTSGVITAKKAGKTVITVKSKADTKKSYKITLTVKNGVKKMKLNSKKKITLTEGEKTSFTPKVTTYKKVKKTIVASSSDKKVATVKVNSKGKVTITAKKEGTAVVTVKPKFGSDKAEAITVTVKAAPAPAETVLTPEYKTKVVFANPNAKEVVLTGTISWDKNANMQEAVKQFAKALGGTYTLSINSKSLEVVNGNVDAAELAKIPVSGSEKDAKIQTSITIAEGLKLIENVDAKTAIKLDGQFTINKDVVISNISLANKKISFKFGKMAVDAYVEDGVLYLDGDQSALFKTYEAVFGGNKSVIAGYEVIEK